MSSPKIALFADKSSPQIEKLRDIVREEGAQPLVFDIRLGGESSPSVTLAPDRLRWDGVDFSDIASVHVRYRALNTPITVTPLLTSAHYSELRCRFLREQEHQSVTFSFFDQLMRREKLVINPFTSASYLDHDAKAQRNQKFAALGLPVPRTLTTNDPERALSFLNEVGPAVAKPAIGVGTTRRVLEADLERLAEFRACPVLLQELIIGDTLRVHIVADSVVLALKVISDGQVDSRTGVKGVEYFKLPDAEEARLVEANRALGLQYAGWDILATSDRRYFYLDCNPGPYLMWVGEENAAIVLRELARYMIAYARTRSVPEAARAVRPWQPSYL